MIEFRKGDILKAEVEAMVNTVNCVGVMGRGMKYRKVLAVVVVLSMFATCSGCSWVFVGVFGDTVSDDYEPSQPIDCSSTTMPTLDTALAVMYLIMTIVSISLIFAGSDECTTEKGDLSCFSPKDLGVMMAPGAGVFTLIHGFSAWSGWCWADECEAAYRAHHTWYESQLTEKRAAFHKLLKDRRCEELKKVLIFRKTSVDVQRYVAECRDLAREDATSEDAQGRTSLHLAVMLGSFRDTQVALSMGANINARDKYGWTPLHYAASTGSNDLAKYLLKMGAAVNVKNNEGKTPLMIAEEKGYSYIVTILKRASRD